MLTIFALTMQEIMKKKAFLICFILAAIFGCLYFTALHFSYRSGVPAEMHIMMFTQLYYMGLFLSSMMISLLTLLISVGSISSELETGTMLSIACKPIRRGSIILGKFLGAAAFLLLLSGMAFFAVCISNCLFSGISFRQMGLANIFFAFLLYYLQPLLLLVIAFRGSISLPTLANGVLVVSFYAMGAIGGFIEQIAAITGKAALLNIGILISLISPGDTVFRKMTNILFSDINSGASSSILGNNPFSVLAQPSVWMLVYALLYLFFFLGWSIYAFNKKDIG